MTNTLYYGDNLNVLREHIASASVDLIYLAGRPGVCHAPLRHQCLTTPSAVVILT